MSTSGSFGLLKPHYEIRDDRVIIKRNVWLPFALLLLAAPGGWCLVRALAYKPFDGGLFALGFVGALAGLFAFVVTPWLTPGQIIVTREGIAWRSTKYPRAAIVAVRALATPIRTSAYARHSSWTIVVTLTTKKALVLPLGDRSLTASTEPLMTLERAMTTILG